jgi:hypothetical protein
MPAGVPNLEHPTSTVDDLGHAYPDRPPSAPLLRADGASDALQRDPLPVAIPG